MMPDKKKGKKAYEPPIVKEIGGVFEQAMGLSSCIVGTTYSSNCIGGNKFGLSCITGGRPSGNCSGGGGDQSEVCMAGHGVSATDCTRGVRG